jgi:hypothetical protein
MLLLEQRGADVVITEEVVKAAAGNEESGKDVMIVLLEQRGADVVITDDVVKAATTCGQERVLGFIEEWLEISLSKDDWSTAQFYNAAKSGNENIIQKLLADGVNPDLKNIRRISPLWIAATNGHCQVVKVLLATGLVEVNSESISGQHPICWAAARGHEGVVKLLLQAGADAGLIDKDGNTPLSIAKQHGFYKIERMMASQYGLRRL